MSFVKALIAEDDPTVRCLIAEAVEELEIVAVECSNGRKAWEILQDNPGICLLITDVRMPEMGGTELVRALRRDGRLRQMPVIITSAIVQASDIEDVLETDKVAFITKPLSVLALQELVRNLLLPKNAE